MAKQKKAKFDSKNVSINPEELSITKIGELTTAEQNPLFIFILVGILLVFIFFLPTIVDFIKGSNEKPDYSTTGNQNQGNNKNQDNDNENENDNTFYTFSSTLAISLEEKLKADTFSLTGNSLSFGITNSGDTRYYFNRENYFLELYSEEETLLERVILSDIVVSKGESEVVTYSLNPTTALEMKKLKFTKKEIADYPNVTLEKNENEEEVLVCKKDNQTITYKFQEAKLFSITDIVNYSSNTVDYAALLQNYRTTSDALNSREGIQSVFVDAGNGFVVNTTIDLKTAKLENDDSVFYYPNETLAKVVKFEMDARGYQCN